MDQEFQPPRRNGILFQGGLILLVLLGGLYFFYLAAQDQIGLDFLLHMLITLIIFAPLPLLLYRLYALLTAIYVLRREGLLIRWGLRREEIPLNNIEWIRPATELGFRLPLPALIWPGALLGSRHIGELGIVEFLSADLANMILIATPEKVYAISPAKTSQFISHFRQLNELGSLMILEPQSVYPAILLDNVLEDRLSRILILSGFGVGLLLLAVVAIAVAGIDFMIWPGSVEPAPAERLLLLPILNGMIWLFNLFFGFFLFRRGGDLRLSAYLLWGTAIVTGCLILIASLRFIF